MPARSDRFLLAGGTVIVALIGAGQALHDGSEVRIGSDTRMAWFVALQAVAVVAYLLAVARVLRQPPRAREVWSVLAVAVAMRAIPLAGAMFLSSDLFRYIWDGRVQLAGINPYQYVPADPALAALRDPDIYRLVNRAATAHTIYPPAAQILFAAIAWVRQTPRAVRVAMVLCEVVAVAALALTLRRRHQPSSRILIYAWNPLTAWEFAGNGHVDALCVACLALALLARTLDRPAATGVALAAATLVKFLPAVVAPALWRWGDWRAPLAGLIVMVALYICFAGAGWHVLGFLPGYADEEGLRDGSGIWALAGAGLFVDLPRWAGQAWLMSVACALALAAVALIRAPARDPARACGLLMVGVTLAMAPHYPWYYPWLAIPAVLAPVRSAIWLSAASVLLYLSPLHERFIWPALVFVPALVLFWFDINRVEPAPIATGD